MYAYTVNQYEYAVVRNDLAEKRFVIWCGDV